MSTHKTPVNAYLNDEELTLLKQAQEKYITDGNGNASIRTILLIGAKCVLSKTAWHKQNREYTLRMFISKANRNNDNYKNPALV